MTLFRLLLSCDCCDLHLLAGTRRQRVCGAEAGRHGWDGRAVGAARGLRVVWRLLQGGDGGRRCEGRRGKGKRGNGRGGG